MVGINIDMPKACTSVQETLGDIEISNCPLYNVCKYRDIIKNNYKPSNCPLVEVEEHNVGHWIHGRWIHGQCGKDDYIKCNKCGREIVQNIITLEGDVPEDVFVLCPFCGAKMRRKE